MKRRSKAYKRNGRVVREMETKLVHYSITEDKDGWEFPYCLMQQGNS